MTVDIGMIGHVRDESTLLVTRDRLRLFAKATGQTDPLFVNVAVARRSGHPDLPVPATFFFAVNLQVPDPFAFLVDVGVDLRSLLHGEQSFVYHRTAHAGDTLTSRPVVVDVFEKKQGALKFVVTETEVVDNDGAAVVTMRETVVIRQLVGVNA